MHIDVIKELIIIYTNFIIMIFNLIPIYPLDGGRILQSIMYIFMGKRKSEKYTNIISKATVAIISIIASVLILKVHNIAIILIVIYLWFLVIKESEKYKKREYIYKKILENKTI